MERIKPPRRDRFRDRPRSPPLKSSPKSETHVLALRPCVAVTFFCSEGELKSSRLAPAPHFAATIVGASAQLTEKLLTWLNGYIKGSPPLWDSHLQAPHFTHAVLRHLSRIPWGKPNPMEKWLRPSVLPGPQGPLGRHAMSIPSPS